MVQPLHRRDQSESDRQEQEGRLKERGWFFQTRQFSFSQVIGTTSINVWSLIEQPNMEYRLQPFILKVVLEMVAFFGPT